MPFWLPGVQNGKKPRSDSPIVSLYWAQDKIITAAGLLLVYSTCSTTHITYTVVLRYSHICIINITVFGFSVVLIWGEAGNRVERRRRSLDENAQRATIPSILSVPIKLTYNCVPQAPPTSLSPDNDRCSRLFSRGWGVEGAEG